MGPLLDFEYEHMEGRPVDHHGIPRFEKATFDAAYPFGIVNLSDKNLPVEVKIKAFNPLIPGDPLLTPTFKKILVIIRCSIGFRL